MKKLGFLLAMFTAAAFTASCGGDEDKDWSGDFGTIKVSDTRQLEQTAWADQKQATQGVSFTTEAAWSSAITETTRTQTPDWISITPDHGTAAGKYTIRIELGKNTTGEDRSAVIVIDCSGSKITITVTQSARKEDGTIEEDPVERDYFDLRRIVEYNASGKEVERMTFEFETQQPGRITALKYWDAGENTPYTTHTFAYTGDSEMKYIDTYTDKGTYNNETKAKGVFVPDACRIESAAHTDHMGNKSERLFNYSGTNLLGITYRTPSTAGDGTYDSYTDSYYWQESCCTEITWHTESPQPDSQTFEFDRNDIQTSISRGEKYYRRVTDGRNINLALLLIEEPSILRALGYYGTGDAFLPKKVTTTYGSEVIREEFSYSYNFGIPAASEGEVMRIVVKRYENGTLQSTKTYGVIGYAN